MNNIKKPDISSREDIKLIIEKFYDLLLEDKKMLPFFKEIVQQNHLKKHISDIADFWNDVLFDTNSYKNNVMQKHAAKHTFMAFKKEHFTIWTSYFFKSINTKFNGEKAELMKNRATSIATVMQLKLEIYQN
jgi:hemoglobin